tara:strand:+ start:118 stop:1074 length:957 start_codon:yes stop_codon:yes gene_type:complete
MRQNFRDFQVLVIDNGSDDGTVEFIRAQYPTVAILQNFKNLGFAKANDKGIKLAKSEYVLVMNPDVILSDDFLQNMINFADQHPEAGSFGGKTFKLFSAAIDQADQSGLREAIKSDVIDSTGLQIYKSRRVVNRGEGKKDKGQYDRLEEVFGVSASCALYRKSVLDEVLIKDEYFDNNFFAYKEDIDLAWRMRLYGWQCWYVPEAVCYHHRRLSAYEETSLKKRMASREAVSKMLRSLSFRNHHLMLVKNDQWINTLLALPWFLFWELRIILFALIFEPFQYKSITQFFKYLPATLLKRRVIMAHKKVAPREIRKWFR